jgi:hypothetical protein
MVVQFRLALWVVAAAAITVIGCKSEARPPAVEPTSSRSSASVATSICDNYPPANEYEGLSEPNAIAKGAPDGVRVVERDGVPLPILKNLDANRVSLVINDGHVSHACRF